MEYENKQPNEGINVSDESPLKQFAVLLSGAFVLLLVLFFAFSFFGGWVARFIPFSAEVALMDNLGEELEGTFNMNDADPLFVARQAELNALADRVMAHMEIPEGMEITVHYVDEEVFNAFATLGGHVFFFQGLIELMPHENALAMVMAHEIAHEIHRDPISGLGGGITATVMLSAVFQNSGTAAGLLNTSSLVGSANFTKRMESRADQTAIDAVNKLYGHVAGADALFTVLAQSSEDEPNVLPDWAESFVSTHPLHEDRIAAIAQTAKENEWRTSGELAPLPQVFKGGSSENEK